MKKQILFVDDEPNVLHALRRMLRYMREEWNMVFVGSGEEALEALTKERYDVVVSDIRMPKMDGVQLLTEIKSRYPQIIRIALSGQSDQEVVLRSVGSTHQFLAKPCDAATLKAVIERSSTLHSLLSDESLKQLITRLESLPSLPSLYIEIVEELKSPMSSMAKVGDTISKDIGMTAKVLQLVNSAYFGLPHRVSKPSQAAALLGLDIIRGLVLSVHVFTSYNESNLKYLDIEKLWKHSTITSILAKEIARSQKSAPEIVDDSFMAGLLHDIGILVLIANLPDDYSAVIETATTNSIALIEAEKRIINATHAEIGGYLLGLWGLPDSIVEAVYYHHDPNMCLQREFSPLTAVYVANVLESHRSVLENVNVVSYIDMEYLENLELTDRLPIWQDIQAEIDKRGENNE